MINQYAIQVYLGDKTINEIPVLYRDKVNDLLNNSIDSLVIWVQDKKWEEIKAERDRLETAGIPIKNKYLDYDMRSVMKLTKAATGLRRLINQGLATEETTINWTMQDNSIESFTCSELEDIDIIAMNYSNMLHEKGRLLREQIYSNSNIQEIYNIKWE